MIAMPGSGLIAVTTLFPITLSLSLSAVQQVLNSVDILQMEAEGRTLAEGEQESYLKYGMKAAIALLTGLVTIKHSLSIA